jgi:hypothetical protein
MIDLQMIHHHQTNFQQFVTSKTTFVIFFNSFYNFFSGKNLKYIKWVSINGLVITPISIKVLNDQYLIKKCDMIRETYVLSYGTIKKLKNLVEDAQNFVFCCIK